MARQYTRSGRERLACFGLVLFVLSWLVGSGSSPGDLLATFTGSKGEQPPLLLREAQSRGNDVEVNPPNEKMDGLINEGDVKTSLKDAIALIHNKRGVPDSQEKDEWKRKKQKHWKLIILFQHNLPILQQAVDGFRRASDIMVENLIVVDNSLNKEAFNNDKLRKSVAEVVRTPRLLNFPELHNYMAELALKKNLEFYFWAHADNYVLPSSAERDLAKDIIDCMRIQIQNYPNWGMMLFAYDHLAAYRTQTIIQVPWDPFVFQYGSECDAYGRIRDAGYDARACSKLHRSYDMKRVLNITDSMGYDETLALLEQDKEFKLGRNQWREGSMSQEEKEWREEMKLASRKYLEEKWVVRGCKLRGLPCHKPWPVCPKCPQHIPDCYSKRPSTQQLLFIHDEVKRVFAEQSKDLLTYESFLAKRKKQ
eukprot:m.71854 g.71854  ORF g.71854 m.71854 type:complete len:423 (-) comp12281_c0_seq2:1806-3074(-)